MQFAPVPDPTKAQLQQFGYLEKSASIAEEKATKSLPDAKTWAGKLGINTSYELLSSAQNNISADDYELVIKARDVILEHLKENGGSLAGIRSTEANSGLPVEYLNSLFTQLGYKDIGEFERDTKAGKPLRKPSVQAFLIDDQIQTLYYPAELEAVLRSIHGKAQVAIEETGAGILYLSLGFLEWYESEDSDKARLAPLFTVPVTLEKGKLDPQAGLYRYHLRYTGEDIIPNLSLQEKLQGDFGIALPNLDDETLPENYFKQVQAIIEKNKPRWNVRRYGALSLLNFSKMLMYLDLDPERWPQGSKNLLNHEVIKRLFTSQAGNNSNIEDLSREYSIDTLDNIHEKFPLIYDADSSQHSALIDAVDGVNLVIEGPPGTGKSQTITNLIAAAMLNGKKVLFVAEKLAALEVVKHRLDKAGLGDFCLELHSHKSHKRKVLEDIQQRLHNPALQKTPAQIDAEISRYEELKSQLNSYAQEINEIWKNTELTIHQILTGATRYRRELGIDPTQLHIENLSGQKLDRVAQLRLRDQIKEFKDVVVEFRQQVGEQAELWEHPWYGVNNVNIQLFDSDRIVSILNEWNVALISWQQALSDFLNQYSIVTANHDEMSWQTQLIELSGRLPDLPAEADFQAYTRLDDNKLEHLKNWLADFNVVQADYRHIADYLMPEKLRLLEEGGAVPDFPDITKTFGLDSATTLADVVRLIRSLEQMHASFESDREHLSALLESLPSSVSERFPVTPQGFNQIATFIYIAFELPGDLVKYRNERFDDDGIEPLIEELSQRLASLQTLRDQLKSRFVLNKVTDDEQLKAIESSLHNSGLFSWLSGSWRQAKNALIGLSSASNTKWKALYDELPKLRQYAQELAEFEARNFSQIFGELYQGLETEPSQIRVLRDWYSKVRSVWGIGFGANVAIGSALLTLDSQIFKGIQQLKHQGVDTQVLQHLTKLKEYEETIPSNILFPDNTQTLAGETNIFSPLITNLKNALFPIQQWFTAEQHTLEAVNEKIIILHRIQEKQRALIEGALPGDIFSIANEIAFGASKDNTKPLNVMSETITFTEGVRDVIKNSNLTDVIKKLSGGDEYRGLQKHFHTLKQKWETQKNRGVNFVQETQLDTAQWQQRCKDRLSGLIDRNEDAISKPRWLNGWLNFTRVSKAIENNGLQRIRDAIMSHKLAIEHIDTGLQVAVFDQLAREVASERPYLLRVSGNSRSAMQKTFRDYDKVLQTLQRERIAAVIASNPVHQGASGGRKADYTEMALIRNETGKKTRHIPIRQLINRAGRALLQLKPCFMMGPMSAANYLQPGDIEFDLVVMDEASQVKPEDALGVIARGKQIVVVGDPKQLPPTSFFDRAGIDDDDEDTAAVSQTDSILDASLPLFKMRRLRWHYRSQHESLIAYSNRHFYNSDLVVFPSPNAHAPEYGVKFSFVKNGRFINQHNIEEARVIAKAVALHAIHSPEESLGIVAMNSKQREQIERAIDEMCREDTQAETAIDRLRMKSDALFVKNLENVQGDERDVIFISFTYGPGEADGKVYQRFGPINSDVGWRRLNVLFTRSKKRMHIFSSMRAEDVQVTETSKRGVQALRGFLHFAEKGNMDGLSQFTGKAPDSDFEVAVIKVLENAGFRCEPQVGVAGFFIDIAVRDPGKQGRYLMGIECDGATYHSAKSARDRDRLRQDVLEGLGWRIRRIWSTDWFSNPDEVLAPILRELHQLKTQASGESYSEEQAIAELVVEEHKNLADIFAYNNTSEPLKARLERFAREIIDAACPDIPVENRLLRPAMIEALVEHQPLSRSEFVERIPKYLREATDSKAGKTYLNSVLALIDGEDISSEI
ncbi:DNA helicase related protein [Pantoea sp. AS-PWVM4]|nr:DNA helicase related protein [Pantoea sp. AS-PWVM4]